MAIQEVLALIGLLVAMIGGWWAVVAYLLRHIAAQRVEIDTRLFAAEAKLAEAMHRSEAMMHFGRIEAGINHVHTRMDKLMELMVERPARTDKS